MTNTLPIDSFIPSIVEQLRREKKLIVVAPPGSGKTTRIPPALTAIGRTILLQPRRVAARALARRIAAERRWTVGEEIGWHIRFERRFSPRTTLLVATEGILTARLQSDPLLTDFDVVVLDEFHERSIHADLALALVRQAALSRDDLHIVVMSATLDAGPLCEFLGASVVDVPSRTFPVEVRYRHGATVAAAVGDAIKTATGHILCFLPGAREIERAASELSGIDAQILPLHGSLDVDAQERALAPSTRRKVILATNVAETSLTVEGVTDVIDSGLQKVLRYDAETAVDHLITEQISADSAVQRAGRAGRTAPGRATRLWDERSMLRAHREPEVQRIDLTATVLDIIAWGGDPKTFEWFERPAEERIDAATRLLEQLGAVEQRRLTPLGDKLRQLPLHPRLARMVLAANGDRDAIALAVEISEGVRRPASGSIAEIAQIAQRLGRWPRSAQTSAAVTRNMSTADATLRRAALAGYPDRVAMRRESGSPRLLLATGTGLTLAREIEHTPGEFFVALDVRGEIAHRVMQIEREWLTSTRREVVHTFEDDRVRAVERVCYGSLLLHEQQVPVDPAEAQRLLSAQISGAVDPLLQRRVAFAQLEIDWNEIGQQAAAGAKRLDDIDLAAHLPYATRRRLDELAPLLFTLPSGRSAKLDYRDDGSVFASAKLQELFGLAETPCVGPRRTPITFQLLAPNGRPVQVTQDLRNFWNTTYQEVRKELRGRYAKHPWPEDPWTATPTHRARKRK